MHVVNCHQNTEAADLLGGLRPLRGRDILVQELRDRAKALSHRCVEAAGGGILEGHVQPPAGVASPFDTMDVAGVTASVQVTKARKAPLSEASLPWDFRSYTTYHVLIR